MDQTTSVTKQQTLFTKGTFSYDEEILESIPETKNAT